MNTLGCTCGFGGFHDDINPRCELYGQQTEEEAWETVRQTVNCPTCQGYRRHSTDSEHSHLCLDCTDGKIPMARLLAVGAAVYSASAWREFSHEYVDVGGVDCVSASDLLRELRKASDEGGNGTA